MPNKTPLQGRVALVTGVGRSVGIGAAICRAIAGHGGHIFFAYWPHYDSVTHSQYCPNDPSTIADELRQLGARVEAMEIDLANPHSAEILFRAAEDRIGPPSILVNNACHDFEVPFVDLSPEILDTHYAVNVRSVALLCREFVRRGNPGNIINMTSGQSLGSMGGHKIPYSITKAALEMLAPQLAPELLPLGITIHAVDPGPTDTGWMTAELRAQISRQSPRGRFNTPEEIARLVLSLLTQPAAESGKVIHAPR